MEQLEIEVKFHIANPAELRVNLLELGAVGRGRVFESNIRFEDAHHTLIQRQSLLRLRQDAKATLTYKALPPAIDKNFKILRELEVEVQDFATMHDILQAIGFHGEQVYEKWRETFSWGETLLCMDTMPYGVFLEIEGAKVKIRELARRIGLHWKNRILMNYLEMFQIIRAKAGLTFHDVTFSNFEGLRVETTDFIPLFTAGTVRE